jgi:anti-sigma B factor antagonist
VASATVRSEDEMDLLTVSVFRRGSAVAPYTVVTLAGELDATNNLQLRQTLEAEIAAGPRRLIVDLSDLAFMDSSALKVLLHSSRALGRNGGAFAFACPRGTVARVLELTQAGQLVPVCDSVEQAAASLSS